MKIFEEVKEQGLSVKICKIFGEIPFSLEQHSREGKCLNGLGVRHSFNLNLLCFIQETQVEWMHTVILSVRS